MHSVSKHLRHGVAAVVQKMTTSQMFKVMSQGQCYYGLGLSKPEADNNRRVIRRRKNNTLSRVISLR